MTGIQFVTDEKGLQTAALIDLKKHGALWEDFWDGLVSECRRNEKSIPYQEYWDDRLKRGRPRGQLFALHRMVCTEGTRCVGWSAVCPHRPEDYGAYLKPQTGGIEEAERVQGFLGNSGR